MKTSTKVTLLGAALLSAATLAPALLSPGSPGAEPAREAQPVLTVEIATPQLRQWSDDIGASGRLVAWQESSIGAELGELRLVDIRVDVGDRVRKGQLLAQFDTQPVQAELNERIALLAETQALLVEAEENARRGESLRNTGALSHQVITQYVTRAQAVRAQVDSAQARVDSYRLRLQQTRVLAPDDGVISARSATLGSVGAAGTELFRLIRQGRIEWHAEVPAAQIRYIAIGQAVTMSLPEGSSIEGSVRQIAPTLAEDLTAIVYVTLRNDEQALARIGMYLKGEIASGVSQALTIPMSSVVVRDGREYAFAMAADNKVVQAPIKTGRRHGAEVEILTGLSLTQAIVVSGGGFLHDGDLVRVATAQTSVAQASAP
jgi:RND family efflux transporter MFP subunit